MNYYYYSLVYPFNFNLLLDNYVFRQADLCNYISNILIIKLFILKFSQK